MSIVLQYRASTGFRAQIEGAFGPGVVAVIDEDDEAAFARAMPRVEVLLHVLKPVTAEVIAASPRLRLVQKLGVGVNTIDLEAARARGIAVCNMPGTNSQAVAEMTLSLLMACLRRTVYFDALTRAGRGWSPDAEVLDATGEVAGRTVGLVGFGQAAQRFTPVLEALGARVIYTARHVHEEAPHAWRSLDDLLAEADVISLHIPLTDETRGLIGSNALARMKPGAILINTARGELVDEVALVDALKSGRLRAAGLDVFAREPTPPDNPLLALPQVVLAPHVAWLTPETLDRSLTVAFENVRRLSTGEPLLHQVV